MLWFLYNRIILLYGGYCICNYIIIVVCKQFLFSSSCFNGNIIILFYGLSSWKKLLYLKDAVGICYRTRDYVHGIQEGNIGICIHKGRSQRVAKSTCPSQKLFYIAQQGGLHVFAGVVSSRLLSWHDCCWTQNV